jgi:hypothetical protein
VSAKGLIQLAMDQASRMARAREMGFDTNQVYYHGTNKDISNFSTNERGSATDARSAKQAFFFSDSPRTAQSYAHNSAINVPVQQKIKLANEAGDAGDWDKYDTLIDKAENLEKALNAQRQNGQNIIPTYLPTQDDLRMVNMRGRSFDDFGVSDEVAQELTWAKQDGLKGVLFKDFNDSAGLAHDPSNHIAIFDPANIRSVNAAFDPAKKNSSDLLGSADPRLLAATALGTGTAVAAPKAQGLLETIGSGALELLTGAAQGVAESVDDFATYGNPRGGIGRAISPQQAQKIQSAINNVPGLLDTRALQHLQDQEHLQDRNMAGLLRNIGSAVGGLLSPI